MVEGVGGGGPCGEERGKDSLSVGRASRIEKDACRGTCARVEEVPARLHKPGIQPESRPLTAPP